MRIRKLVKLGSSLFVSIPAEWARSLNLREGSEVALDLDDDSLVLRPALGDGRRALVGPPVAHRKLLAAYLGGCSEIRVDLRGMSGEEVKKLEDMAASLIGLEKVYQDSGSVVYACFVDDDQDPQSISGRIVDIISTMVTDAAEALDSGSPERLLEVASRDNVVDRLYFLLVRVLRSTTEMPRAKLMDYRAMSKILERMGDEVAALAVDLPSSWEPTDLSSVAKEIASMVRDAHGLFLSGGPERAEALADSAWGISCRLHRESVRREGFAARAYRTYSIEAGLVKDLADLVI